MPSAFKRVFRTGSLGIDDAATLGQTKVTDARKPCVDHRFDILRFSEETNLLQLLCLLQLTSSDSGSIRNCILSDV